MKCDQILTRLKRLGKPGAVEGMARYGIKCARACGVSAPELRKLAQFLPIIEHESIDERHYVKKAVNWALRQIGKRNKNLNRLAIETGERIANIDSRSARWIASDALRELRSDKVRSRLMRS